MIWAYLNKTFLWSEFQIAPVAATVTLQAYHQKRKTWQKEKSFHKFLCITQMLKLSCLYNNSRLYNPQNKKVLQKLLIDLMPQITPPETIHPLGIYLAKKMQTAKLAKKIQKALLKRLI